MLGNNRFDIVNTLKRLPKLPRDFFVTTVLTKLKPIYPTSMIFNVSWRCNAKCIMCNCWQRPYDKDLTLEEIQAGFKSRLFRKIANLGISGGEPFMRKDLPEIIESARENMPRLVKVTINTNGFATKTILKSAERIITFCEENKLLLGIRISLDGIDKKHDVIRGTPGGFDMCMRTFDGFMELRERYFFNFGLAYTISPINVRDAGKMHEFCRERNINVIYNVPRISAAFLDNEHLEANVLLDEESQAWVAGFFRRLVREGKLFNGDIFLYHQYVKQYENGGFRTMDCPYQHQGIILNPFGELIYCEMSKTIGNIRDGDPADVYFDRQNLEYRKQIKKDVCPTCLSPCMASVNAAHQVTPYLKFAGEVAWDRLFHRPPKNSGSDTTSRDKQV